MSKSYVIATSKLWDNNLIETLTDSTGGRFIHIAEKEKLDYESLAKIKPRYIFYPHWSYIIPQDIYDNFECIIFHMTDVPFGRGGSPLQNLIERGIYQTKISALKAVKELDAGDVYLKSELPLDGSAEEIYIRAAKVISNMIKTIIENEPLPAPQSGKAVTFQRRIPNQSNIADLDSLENVFDYIRMLDAEGYPHAFLETNNLKLEFRHASLKKDSVIADVKISIKDKTGL